MKTRRQKESRWNYDVQSTEYDMLYIVKTRDCRLENVVPTIQYVTNVLSEGIHMNPTKNPCIQEIESRKSGKSTRMNNQHHPLEPTNNNSRQLEKLKNLRTWKLAWLSRIPLIFLPLPPFPRPLVYILVYISTGFLLLTWAVSTHCIEYKLILSYQYNVCLKPCTHRTPTPFLFFFLFHRRFLIFFYWRIVDCRAIGISIYKILSGNKEGKAYK